MAMGNFILKNHIVKLLLAALLSLSITGTAWAAAVDYAAIRTANGGQLAEKLRFVTTTEPAAIFTFGGLSRRSSVEDVLSRLKANGMKGTFFVTERELKRYPDTIQMIANSGQELAIGINNTDGMSFEQVCQEINRIQDIMSQRYGVRPKFVRQMFGAESDEFREAVSAMGCILIGQTVNVVQSKDKEAQSAAEIMPKIFNKWFVSLGRGQIVYIRTDFYTNEYLAGDMVDAIKKNKVDNIQYRSPLDTPETNSANDTAYSCKGVGEVYDNAQYRYSYPVDMAKVPENLRPENKPLHVDDKNFHEVMKGHYIGAPGVGVYDRAYEFKKADFQLMDTTGVIKTVSDNTIFLTFDDWGTDHSISRLLYVLRKHKVHGTFFIITWNMVNNPNLLRSIAMEGHEIGSHTDRHIPMSNNWVRAAGDDRVQTPEEYYQDIASSYEKLVSVVGDVQVNGKYSLHRFMRPPTLAISKTGVKNIFNAGFEYIVSGYESTEDYAAQSRQSMIAGLQHGAYQKDGTVRKGAIMIMHMTDEAKYTAEALDIFLTANEALPDWDPRKFKVGLLGDYLREGYSQYMN